MWIIFPIISKYLVHTITNWEWGKEFAGTIFLGDNYMHVVALASSYYTVKTDEILMAHDLAPIHLKAE